MPGGFSGGADGLAELAPQRFGLAGGVDRLSKFLLRGRTAERGELDRHQRRQGRVEVSRGGVMVLERVGELVGVGDQVG